MKNTTEIKQMSQRDLSAGITMGWNNWGGLTARGQADVLPRLIEIEGTLAIRRNQTVTFPEVNGLTLDQARNMRRVLLDIWDTMSGELHTYALPLATALEDRITRLAKTQATRDRMTLALSLKACTGAREVTVTDSALEPKTDACKKCGGKGYTLPAGATDESRTFPCSCILPKRETVCTKCGEAKNPSRAYLGVLKASKFPYVCKSCRENGPVPPMSLGKLGVL